MPSCPEDRKCSTLERWAGELRRWLMTVTFRHEVRELETTIERQKTATFRMFSLFLTGWEKPKVLWRIPDTGTGACDTWALQRTVSLEPVR